MYDFQKELQNLSINDFYVDELTPWENPYLYYADSDDSTRQMYQLPTMQRCGTPAQRCGTPVQRCGTPVQRCGTPVQRCGTPVQRCGTPTHTGEGQNIGARPTTPPPQHVVRVAQQLKGNTELARLIVQRQPQSLSELIQIVNTAGGQGQPDVLYGRTDERQPCWGGDALIIDAFFNVYIMDIRLDLFGTWWGWCFDPFSFFWDRCTISQSNVLFFICI